MSKFVVVLALGAGLSSPVTIPAAAREGGNFNGAWSVELVTESGMVCDSRYTYAISVQEGQVRLASASSNATLSGRVGPDGTVGLNVSNGTASGEIGHDVVVRREKLEPCAASRWSAARRYLSSRTRQTSPFMASTK